MIAYRPGRRLLPLHFACVALSGLALAFAPLGALAFGAALALLAGSVGEAIILSRVKLSARRPERQVIPLGESAPLPLALEHDAPAALELRARLLLPELCGGGSRSAGGAAGPGETLALELDAPGVRRGEAKLGPIFVSATRFGLAERLLELTAPARLTVMPNLAAVSRMHQQLNHRFLRGLGLRMAPKLGQGRDFDRLRDYVPGDELRHMAWKSSARQRKLIVREFRVDRSQDVLLCVDRGHRMAGRVGPLSRCDHAVNAGVLAAYLCNRSDDRVGMLSFAAEVDGGVAQGRGGTHLSSVTRFATGIEPDYLHTDYLALAAHLRRRLRARTLVLIFTVLPERGGHAELLGAVRALLPRHLPMVVVLRDAGVEAAARTIPSRPEELFRTLAAGELASGRLQLARELRSLGALVVETTPEASGVAAINAYLDVKRRQLL